MLGKGEQLSHPLGAFTGAQSTVKQKQEMEDNKATVNSGATIKPLDKMSPPKESESVSGSRDSPPMEVGASASAKEEGGIVVEKGKHEEAVVIEKRKDEKAKVLEPSDLEEEGSLAGDEGGNNSWLPTPSLVNSREGLAGLVAQQQRDELLNNSGRKAGKGEEGYCMDNGVLIHVKATNLGRELVRIVVPKQRRLHLLDLGHRGLVDSHFSHNKMRPALTEHFTWPGIKQDIK